MSFFVTGRDGEEEVDAGASEKVVFGERGVDTSMEDVVAVPLVVVGVSVLVVFLGVEVVLVVVVEVVDGDGVCVRTFVVNLHMRGEVVEGGVEVGTCEECQILVDFG